MSNVCVYVSGWWLENTTTDGLPHTTLMFTNGPGFNYSAVNGKVRIQDPGRTENHWMYERANTYRSQ